jgi:DinB superfamily
MDCREHLDHAGRSAALTADLSPAQLRSRPNPDDCAAIEVLAHFRVCADVWGGCVTTILAGDHPTIRAINPRTWIKRTDYRELEFRPSLEAYATQRDELLSLLKPLPPDSWSRGATVTGVGKTLERTVFGFARRIAEHERPHIKQSERLVSTLHNLS